MTRVIMIIGKKTVQTINNLTNMTEITITKNERKLLLLFKGNNLLQYDNVKTEISKDEFDSVAFTLNDKKYVDAIFDLQKHCITVALNQKGNAFLLEKPKVRNPFLTDNKKWSIGIGVAIILAVLGIIFK